MPNRDSAGQSETQHQTLHPTQHPAAGTPSVIVVGGGLAGCSAALALARQGLQVTLVESKRRLGGRTGSFQFAENGMPQAIDYCQHVGMGCCTNLRQLIDWLEHTELWETQSTLHFYGPSGRYQALSSLPLVPAPLHLATWLWSWPGLSIGDRLQVARGMLAIGKQKINDRLDDQSAIDWLRSHGQSANVLDNFWKTIIVSALGEDLSRVSLAAVCKVLQDGFLNHREAYHVLVPQLPLSHLFGTDMHRRLETAGVQVRLNSPTLAVRCDEGNSQPEVQFATSQLTADFVVLAVPWHQLGRLVTGKLGSTSAGYAADESMPQAEQSEVMSQLTEIASDAAQLATSPITGIHTWWDQAWLPHPHAVLVGRLCQWVFPAAGPPAQPQPAQPQRGQPSSPNEYYYQIVISASRQLPRGNSEEIGRLTQADLAEVFPAAAKAKLLRCKPVTDPQAVFSVAPGTGKLRPASRVGNQLFLAGDWVRTGWPATMESAVLSGFRAAEEIMHVVGTPCSIAAPALHKR